MSTGLFTGHMKRIPVVEYSRCAIASVLTRMAWISIHSDAGVHDVARYDQYDVPGMFY